jgi:hypothetical protein
MPYWSVYCVVCGGYITDALLECIPNAKRSSAAYRLLFLNAPGAALACPYCGELIGFDDEGELKQADSGWPVFRYGRAELDLKRQADGESAAVTLTDWALRHRFTQPGTHLPFASYLYAEQAPPDEVVP